MNNRCKQLNRKHSDNETAIFHKEMKEGLPLALLKQARSSGQLNLSNRGLVAIPDQVYHLHDLDEAEVKKLSFNFEGPKEKWWDQNDLTKLLAASNKISIISPAISNLISLQVLDLHDNMLESIPSELGSLSNLYKLDLSRNKLKSLDERIFRLHNLKSLHLHHNNLADISDDIGSLINLEDLDIGFNGLLSVPPGIGFLSRVTSLKLSNNMLTSLPPDIGSMMGLRILDLSNNSLKELPDTLGSLSKLEQLNLRHNKLMQFPSLLECFSLKDLQLGNNSISSIDENYFQVLTGLKILDLRDNKVQDIPESISFLKELERIDLTNNELSKLPPQLAILPCLKSLSLQGNPLRSIRKDILQRGTVHILTHLRSKITQKELKQMTQETLSPPQSCKSPSPNEELFDRYKMRSSQSLILSGKEIITLSDEIFESAAAEGVRNIDLSHNNIAEIPQGLLKTNSILQQFNCSFNRLEVLSSILGDFSHLLYLNISNNKLADLPSSLSGLSYLREINISYNRFKSLPVILSTLLKLEILFANDNKIEHIDIDVLTPLERLTTLSLQNNNISKVPPTLGNLTQLNSLTLEGNCFRSPRPDILAKGTAALLQYLQSRIPS